MKQVTLAMMATVVAVMAGSAAVMAGDQDFHLVNKTGLTIDEFYVSPSNVNDWEEDVLGVDVLPNGESVDVAFSRDEEACVWDLKIVDEEGDAVVWNKIDLCKASEITLNYNSGRPTANIR